MYITASKLYDFLQCNHRPWRDAYGPQEEKNKDVNAFVQMLWDNGVKYEKKVLTEFRNALDLSKGDYEERMVKTLKAMNEGVEYIYQGVLQEGNLRGSPDFLKRMPDGLYLPVDVKSGMGREGVDEDDEGKLKKSYALQLALYIDALKRKGFDNKLLGYIYDGHGNMVEYDLNLPMGKRNKTTWWEYYQQTLLKVEALLENKVKNDPALSSICGLCPWYKSCKKWVTESGDMSGLFYVGRTSRDTLREDLAIKTIADLTTVDVAAAIEEKEGNSGFLKGIGLSTLQKAVNRAIIMSKTKEPVLYEPINFPKVQYELFFDIEDDPTQEFVYLHGVYERSPAGERFVPFVAKDVTPESEKQAWKEFWDYIFSLPQDDFAVYYYSHHEKTTYKKLRGLYSDVISEEKLNEFFEKETVIDLYAKVILKSTDWPVHSYGLKSLARYCGFDWRDESPSGAASIEWYNKYLETGDQSILERILIYNEDDCKATMVLKDALQVMSEKYGSTTFKQLQPAS